LEQNQAQKYVLFFWLCAKSCSDFSRSCSNFLRMKVSILLQKIVLRFFKSGSEFDSFNKLQFLQFWVTFTTVSKMLQLFMFISVTNIEHNICMNFYHQKEKITNAW